MGNCIVSPLNLAPVSRDMAALRTLFAASMVAVWSAASGNFLASKKDARFIEHSYGSNMSDGNRSGEQDAMKEVSGTGFGGLFPAIGHAVDKTIKGAWQTTKKTAGVVGKGVEKTWQVTKKTAGLVGKGVEKTWQFKKQTAGLVGKGVEKGYGSTKEFLFGKR